jgi:hypothetical protein
MRTRVHLRHTGDSKFRFGVSRGFYSTRHYNIYFGRLFIAIRDTVGDLPTYKPPFIMLDMGRNMLKNRRLWDAMTGYERDLYMNHNPEHLRLEYFLKMIRGTDGG